jgi:hypothetical protein
MNGGPVVVGGSAEKWVELCPGGVNLPKSLWRDVSMGPEEDEKRWLEEAQRRRERHLP